MESTFKTDILTNLINQALGLLLGVLSGILVARLLGVSGRGEIFFVTTVTSIGLLIGNLGISSSNIFILGKQRRSPVEIYGNSVYLSLLSGMAILVCGEIYLMANGDALGEVSRGLVMLGILVIPFAILFSNMSSILQGMGKTLLYNKLVFITQAAGGLSVIAAVVLTKSAFGYMLASLAVALCNVIILLKLFSRLGISSVSFDRKLASEQMHYAVRLYASNILSQLILRIDVFIVFKILGLQALGHYSVAVATCEAILMLPYAIGTMLFPRAIAATPAERQRLVTSTFRHTLYLTVFAVIAFEALAGVLIPTLYGQHFREAVLPARVLAPAMVAMGALSVIFNSIASVGANRILFIAPAIALVMNIALNLLLLPFLGVSGASLASTLTYWAEAAISFAVLYSLIGAGIREYLVLKKGDFCLYLHMLKWRGTTAE